MRTHRRLALAAAAACLSNAAFAAANPMSVHVLDQQTGLPSEGVMVVLERRDDAGWQTIGQARTDGDGRITALYPADEPLRNADYRVVFRTGEWYERAHRQSFYPEIQVTIRVDGSVPHYHVPLLLSPYGYTTYRGS